MPTVQQRFSCSSPRSFQNNIFCSFSKLLHGKHKINWQFGIVWPEEHSYPKMLAFQEFERLYLDILVVN